MKHQTVGIVVPEWAKELLDGATHTRPHTSLIPQNDNIKRLVEAIGENHISVKEMLEAFGLKNIPQELDIRNRGRTILNARNHGI